MKKIGLALGAGGSRGYAHIEILKVFDELKIKPSIISGSSMGALIGAMYASGLSAEEIEKIFKENIRKKAFKLADISFHKTAGLIKGDRIMEIFRNNVKAKVFSELKIPLKIVSTDLVSKKEVIMTRGNLIDAVRASISIPLVFKPLIKNNQVLVDGGIVNPLPYDIIKKEADFIIAVDIHDTEKDISKKKSLNVFDIIYGSAHISQSAIIHRMMKLSKPDIYIKPELQGIGIFDFHKINKVMQDTKKDAQILKKMLLEK